MKQPLKRHGFNPRFGKNPWRRARQPTPELFLGKSHGQWRLVCYGLWGRTKLDKTETAKHTHICSKRTYLKIKYYTNSLRAKYKLRYFSYVNFTSRSETCHYFLFPGSRLHPVEPSNNTQISGFLLLGISKEANYSPSYLGFSSPYTWSLCLGT